MCTSIPHHQLTLSTKFKQIKVRTYMHIVLKFAFNTNCTHLEYKILILVTSKHNLRQEQAWTNLDASKYCG